MCVREISNQRKFVSEREGEKRVRYTDIEKEKSVWVCMIKREWVCVSEHEKVKECVTDI